MAPLAKLAKISFLCHQYPSKNSLFFKAVRNLSTKELFYCQFGEPVDVVQCREACVPSLSENQVLVRMIAAPINPADINTIQGKYPVKVELPAIPGNEGVGIVEKVGTKVKNIKPKDLVIPAQSSIGTWRTKAAFAEEQLRVVPCDIGVVEAASLTVNPCTAYRMLTDFRPVRNGHTIIQNGANSACGQNVIQLCKAWNIPNVSIVRNRPDIDQLKCYLKELGATYVLTEEELRTTEIFKKNEIAKPILALNCVGGKNSTEMLRHLAHSGAMVTYGGMSRQPVTIPTTSFIFKNLSFHGFWMTAWNAKATTKEKDAMFEDLICLIQSKHLIAPAHKMVKLSEFKSALNNALNIQGFTGCKYVLDFCDECN